MIKQTLNDIYLTYNIDPTIVNKNATKCLLKSLLKHNLAKIEGQCYLYNAEEFKYLISLYEHFTLYFDFFYSLKTDLIKMFDFLLDAKNGNSKLSFHAFFCPGYSQEGGYKDHLGKTTITKLEILGDVSKMLNKLDIEHEIDCYYCDSYVENCDDSVNSNWHSELMYNRKLFDIEALKYFKSENIIHTSDMSIFKNEHSLSGHIDMNIIQRVNPKVYRSFMIANQVFYKKLDFSEERIQQRNDILATMYIIVSDYINSIKNGIYLPMENMYDREKIISSNGTCTMYLKQGLVK